MNFLYIQLAENRETVDAFWTNATSNLIIQILSRENKIFNSYGNSLKDALIKNASLVESAAPMKIIIRDCLSRQKPDNC